MNTSVIPDAKYQELNFSFTFETQQDKLIIDAKAQNVTYQAIKSFDPDLDFDDLKDALNTKHFKVITKTPETLKLKIGLLNMEFKNQQKIVLNELKETISDLTQKLYTQIQKNTIFEKSMEQLRSQVDLMSTKMSDMFQKFQQKISQPDHNFSSQIKTKVETLQTCLKEEKDKVTALTTQLEDMNKKVQEYEKNQSAIHDDIYQASKNIAKIQRSLLQPKIQINQLANHSKVVTSTEEENSIRGFFPNKTIKSMQMLYRASQNDFLAKKFHEKCDGIPNTLTLCETKLKKKIGGFTPLTWERMQKGEYKPDESGETFIFSLTHKDKFVLKNNVCAIANDNGWSPSFGGAKDFLLTNQSNKNIAVGKINNNFYNENYKKDDPISLQKFHGHTMQNNEGFFYTSEWEVWQVEFV